MGRDAPVAGVSTLPSDAGGRGGARQLERGPPYTGARSSRELLASGAAPKPETLQKSLSIMNFGCRR